MPTFAFAAKLGNEGELVAYVEWDASGICLQAFAHLLTGIHEEEAQ